jgi:hypothetical protein
LQRIKATYLRNQIALAVSMTEALPLAAALYSILRGGVRFFGYALPGQCTNTAINWSLTSGTCIPAGDWLTTRISWATSAHSWSWVMYGGFAIMVAVWQRPAIGRGLSSFALFWRKTENSWTISERLSTFNGWRAFLLVGLGVAIHELFWFGAYYLAHPTRFTAQIILDPNIGYGSFVEMCAIGVVIFFMLDYFRYLRILDLKIFMAGLGVMALYYAGWIAAGYPLTLDLIVGVDNLFASGWVDFIEFGSWLLMFAVLGFAYYAKQIRR